MTAQNGLKISLLGSFEVTLNDEPVPQVASGKVGALLAYLVLESSRPQRREFLAGFLWGEQPEEKALHSLRQALSTLRRALPEGDARSPCLRITPEDVQFNPQSCAWLDVQEFQAACRQGLPHSLGAQAAVSRPNIPRLVQAARLFRGPLLDQFFLKDSVAFEEWLLLQREALTQDVLEVCEQLVGYHTRRGETARARQYAARIVALSPWNENAHAVLMRLYALEAQWSAALNQYLICQRICREQFAAEPSPETTRLFEAIRARRLAENPVPPPARLPAPTSGLIGRENELQTLCDWLADPHCRLVTLHGPGGVGKTRLALEAAHIQAGLFPDGVFWVPLAGIESAGQFLAALTDAFNLDANRDPAAQLADFFHSKHLLLVLDNLETLPGAVEYLLAWLKQAPGLQVLATSRTRLNIHQERLLTLSGLEYPAAGLAGALEQYPASALFMERARRLQPGRSFTADEQAAILNICRKVEGLPLALELAAADSWVQGCAALEAAISRSAGSLSVAYPDLPERHRSLWVTFDHSYRLLPTEDQRCFCCLSVFPVDFSEEAAFEAAGCHEETLARLLDRSLLRRSAAGRLEMHAMLSQFAGERLQEQPEWQSAARQGFLQHFARRISGLKITLLASQITPALRQMAQDDSSLQRAFHWALEDQEYTLAEGWLDAFFLLFLNRGRFLEGIELFRHALAGLPLQSPAALRLRLQARLGALYTQAKVYGEAEAVLSAALALCQAHNLPAEQVFCQVYLATTLHHRGKIKECREQLNAGLALARAHQDDWGVIMILYVQALRDYEAGEIPAALAALEEALALGQAHQAEHLTAVILNLLGDINGHLGNYAQAEAYFQQCLEIGRRQENSYRTGIYLNNLATVYHEQKQFERARELYLQSLAICQHIGDRAGEAITCSNLGEIALAQHDLAEASRQFQHGLEIGEEIQDIWTIITCLNNLGETAIQQGELARAEQALRRAGRLALEARQHTLLTKTIYACGLLLSRQGARAQAARLMSFLIQCPASEQFIIDRAQAQFAAMDTLPAQSDFPALEDFAESLFGKSGK